MKFDFDRTEKEILKFWQENQIFEKLRKKNKGRKPWSFLDGPITANNPMGVHHAWGRTLKDLFQRFKAMQGFDERFQNGFDCQGLWVEVEVEKELGFRNKKEIEEYGIERFVEKCKERVLKYSKIQTEQSIRLGQWMDWENSYFTMSEENNYAIWYFLKKCWQEGLLYKGRDVVPWCPRCGTAISQHEILTEEYKEITHKAVFIKAPLKKDKKTYFLVWTTTPWTLPGNVALAVAKDITYQVIKRKKDNCFYVLAKDQVKNIFKNEEIEIKKEVLGEDLLGTEYEPFFNFSREKIKEDRNFKNAFKVVLADFVSSQEGTGIVHIAPGCGAEDFRLSREIHLPVIDLSDQESLYREGFDELTGKFVGRDEVREWIFERLKQKDLLFKVEDFLHRYPVCWRCKSELIFRLVDEWYIKMDPLREGLKDLTKEINWIPGFGREREIDWLNNMHDWLISKKRYWGLALPIFECQRCGFFEVIGSKEELKQRTVEGWQEFEGHSPHRPWLDNIRIKCSECGALVPRILDVGTPWLDAGIVPFSTLNYFQDRDYWQKWFPAEFICESFPGQFKNWFYVLLVMSYVLERKKPFKTVLGYATVVDEKGEEMHKSKGNAIWFDEAVEKMGADVMRWMYCKQNPASNMRFGYKKAQETKRKLFTLINCYTFFKTYSPNLILTIQKPGPEAKTLLDQWIVSRFNTLIFEVTNYLEEFDYSRASQAIENFFINDLSLWYIRRSRPWFQDPQLSKRKKEAAEVLYWVLLNLTKLIAPFLPFLAEYLYQGLKKENMPQSVHLCDWPKPDKQAIDEELEQEIKKVREIVSEALALRTEKGIKVRQPLKELRVVNYKLKLKDRVELLELIKQEVNVKRVVFEEDRGEERKIDLDPEITPELKEEGQTREIIRHIQALRKKAGLTPKDLVVICYQAPRELCRILEKNKTQILKITRSQGLEQGFSKEGEFLAQSDVKIDNQDIWLAIKKNSS